MKKRFTVLTIICIVCLVLCGCGKSTNKGEDDILKDIPLDFLMIDETALNYDSVEIIKSNSEDGVNDVYFTLNASNEEYEVTADCHFVYNYYSDGGWILDYAQIDDGIYSVVPLHDEKNAYALANLSEDYVLYGISDKYDSITLSDSEFYEENGMFYVLMEYKGVNDWAYYSQEVAINILYSISTNIECVDSSTRIASNNIETHWKGEVEENILSDEWKLDLNLEACDYSTGVCKYLSIYPTGNDSNELHYDGYVSDSDCQGSGTAYYEVNYEDINAPVLGFEYKLLFKGHNMSFYTTIEKEEIYIGFGSSMDSKRAMQKAYEIE